MDVYIDSAILCCFVMNCISLDISCRILKRSEKKRKIAFMSLVMSFICVFGIFFRIMRLLYIPLYAALLLLFFGKCSKREFLRRYAVCTCTSMLLGGTFSIILPSVSVYVLPGGTFFAADDVYFYGFIIIVYSAVRLMIFFVSEKKKMFRIRMKVGRQTCLTYAFMDTGNSLRMPDGEPVVVAESSLFDIDEKDGVAISCKTVGNSDSTLVAYPLDELYLTDEDRYITGAYVAFTDRKFSGEFKVLLHNSMV